MEYQQALQGLRVGLYLLGFLTAALLEQLAHGGLDGIIIALAIYLPVHNWFWGRV